MEKLLYTSGIKPNSEKVRKIKETEVLIWDKLTLHKQLFSLYMHF